MSNDTYEVSILIQVDNADVLIAAAKADMLKNGHSCPDLDDLDVRTALLLLIDPEQPLAGCQIIDSNCE